MKNKKSKLTKIKERTAELQLQLAEAELHLAKRELADRQHEHKALREWRREGIIR